MLEKLKDLALWGAGFFTATGLALAGFLGPKWGPRVRNMLQSQYLGTSILMMIVGLIIAIAGAIIKSGVVTNLGGLVFFIGLVIFILAIFEVI